MWNLQPKKQKKVKLKNKFQRQKKQNQIDVTESTVIDDNSLSESFLVWLKSIEDELASWKLGSFSIGVLNKSQLDFKLKHLQEIRIVVWKRFGAYAPVKSEHQDMKNRCDKLENTLFFLSN